MQVMVRTTSNYGYVLSTPIAERLLNPFKKFTQLGHFFFFFKLTENFSFLAAIRHWIA